MTIPTIDLEPFATGAPSGNPRASKVAAEIDAALREVGFVTVVGHSLTHAVKQAYFDAMRAFFELRLEEKEAIAIGRSDYHRGYVGFEAEALKGALGNEDDAIGIAIVGDLKETLDTGVEYPPDHPLVVAGTPLHGPNQWPDLPGFREAYDAYRDAVVEAALRMQRGLAMALGCAPGHQPPRPGPILVSTVRHATVPSAHRDPPDMPRRRRWVKTQAIGGGALSPRPIRRHARLPLVTTPW